MSNPIVIAHHLIWTLYGWWLPNDLRGGTSTEVRCPWIRGLADLHFGRKKIQPASRDIHAFYEEAGQSLKHPLLELSADAIEHVAQGFAVTVSQFKYTCYACAILRDHVHLIIRKHKHTAEEMIANLQEFSRLRLSAAGLRSPGHPTWVRGGWKVFLDLPEEVQRTIKYIEDNPLPYGHPVQRWDFVKKYDGWPLHPGHSQNSPYVRALRTAGRYPRDLQR
jgi:hypothetical protein